MEAFNKLVDWFLRNAGDRAIVALSGGVDSAVVALAAKKALGNGAIAITANYKTLAEEELAVAWRVAREIGIKHKVIEYNELENASFVKNDTLRCYYCRTELGQHLAEEARRTDTSLIVDGTNIDDLKDYRPGIRALREKGVRSPMIELGIGKIEIREIAKSFGLSVYDKPSNACLASRIPTGSEVTYEKLQRIENAEIIVKTIFSVRQVRVRDHSDLARIEVGRDELHKMFDVDKLALLDKKLKELAFKFVSVDVAGYKTGNLVTIDRYD
ncbi:MAG TPA: ATP-dependent sacrificial sulfur transferase LarE [Nitrososphaera sp.]|jgi:pyridinium-3,5-biscarboxylic acid mononucleotide sulfurtransferase|nr:ATP-dependent sacrificial sulfur transferase LarE [Nitrososphaera sp.]